jgi:citrate/tricarballylate utilization protein
VPHEGLTALGTHVLTVCNACRYCEQYCPVFPAMENRVSFAKGDVAYLANLCHNCGECLYACQYAPPHEFGIDVPRTLARIRKQTYEEYCWPQPLAAAFRRSSLLSTAVLVLVLAAAMLLVAMRDGTLPGSSDGSADFYAVLPHDTMIAFFGAAFLFAIVSLSISIARFWRDIAGERPALSRAALFRMVGDIMTLRHLHEEETSCTTAEETRTPWRRRLHHITYYGFLLCFASTAVAALYHVVFGWKAPYAYSSLPVILGSAGGVGLLIGPIGLFILSRQRDVALTDPSQRHRRVVHRASAPDERDGYCTASRSSSVDHERAAYRAPGDGASVFCHAALWKIRARHLSRGRAS